MNDITDEEVALIRAESEAYDLAHPTWREEAEARRAAWKKDTMPDFAKARSTTVVDPELKAMTEQLRFKLDQRFKHG